ncbi:MAG TPA: hypothetical protein VNT60_05510 [Deinococcales bacterium]|nr:hypothetical protein [Deinococcales bacterium]
MKKRQGLGGKLRQLVVEAAGAALIAIVLNELRKRQLLTMLPGVGQEPRRENVERPAERLSGGDSGHVAPRHDHGDRGEERMPLTSDAPAGATLEDLAKLNGVTLDKPAQA